MSEELTEAAYAKALELAKRDTMHRAFASYIMQVSDAAKELGFPEGSIGHEILAPFILPEPVDPLDALASHMAGELDVSVSTAKQAIEQLVATGLIKIVEAGHG